MNFLLFFIIFNDSSKSSLLTVNVRSVVLLSEDTFCITMSTFILALPKGSKISAAIPGLSCTPSKVILASFFEYATPVTTFE